MGQAQSLPGVSQVWGSRYVTGRQHCVVSAVLRRDGAYVKPENGLLILPGESGTASQKL